MFTKLKILIVEHLVCLNSQDVESVKIIYSPGSLNCPNRPGDTERNYSLQDTSSFLVFLINQVVPEAVEYLMSQHFISSMRG